MIESRKEAIAAGVRRYFTGKPCPKGHMAERSIDNCGCVACHADIRAKNRDGQRAYAREHYRANKEIYIGRAVTWGLAHPEKVRESKRKNYPKWAAANPEKVRANNMNRRARLTGAGQARHGRISGDEILAVVSRQKGRCAACGKPAKLEMDHIMPLALGGDGHRRNFQGLCKPCNIRKHAKHPIDFNRSMGLLL